MLGRDVAAELGHRSPEDLWDPELRALVRGLDLVVCNLECCISTRGERTALIAGKPFFFRAPPAAVDSLRAIGVGAVGLANNHALDYGQAGLADTAAALRAAGIGVAGAGLGQEEARAAAVVPVAGRRVALIAVTDHPLEYAAAEGAWGVAHADLRRGPPRWLLEEIAAARDACDAVIVFPHWGPNMTTRPARWQRRLASALQAAGAHLIAGHSSHVFHGAARTDAGPVLYDLGDALDDYRTDPELRNDLGILAIWRPNADPEELELVGLRLEYARTELARGADAEWIADRLEGACRELGSRVERLGVQLFRILPAERDPAGRGAAQRRDGRGPSSGSSRRAAG